jgi:hypothetical protein
MKPTLLIRRRRPLRFMLHRLGAFRDRRRGNTSPVLVAIVLLLAVAGGLIGYLVPFRSADPGRGVTSTMQNAAPDAAVLPAAPQTARVASIHRFPLTADDMSETAEAPGLAIDAAGHVYLAFASQTGDAECALLLADSSDGGEAFSEPRVVLTTGIFTTVSESRGRRIERRTRMMPHLATWQDRLYLSWVSAGDQREEVVMQFAESSDGGATWSEPIDVHQSREARPTFTGMGVGDDGTVACSWLDNRNGVQQPFAAVRWAGDAGFSPEQMVYAGPDAAGICPCCPTSAIVAGDAVRVAFRGNEADMRDMWISRLDADLNAFAPPECVVEPTWEFSGCPHDGPSMAETSAGLHMAWMDAHSGSERIYLTTMPEGHPDSDSRASVLAFAAAEDVTQGHPHITADGTRLHLVWDQSLPNSETRHVEAADQTGEETTSHHHGVETDGAGRAVYYAWSDDGGASFSTPVAVAPQPGRFQTRPQVAVGPDHTVFIAWMELSDAGKEVVIAKLSRDEIASPQLAVGGGD